MTLEIQTKKLIAREFLFLLAVIFTALVVFLCTYPYNAYKHHQLEDLSKVIVSNYSVIDSLSKPYILKNQNQSSYFKKMSEIVDLREVNSVEKWWKESEDGAKLDSLKTMWDPNIFNKIGFLTRNDLLEYIDSNTIDTIDIANKKESETIFLKSKALKIKKERNDNSILSQYQQFNLGKHALIILGTLFFLFRYIIYAIQWSLKTLKQN